MPSTKGNQSEPYNISSLLSIRRPAPRTRKQHAIANCKIFTLNDDCLLEIFAYLPTIDLCAAKDSCRRFNALANSIVQQRWKGKAFNCGYAGGRNERENTIILQHFGHIIENVMIMKQESVWPVKKRGTKRAWVQLRHYTSLKKLTVFHATVNRLPITPVKRPLQYLESLDLVGCVGADSEFARIINACKNLKNLRMEYRPSILLLSSICHEVSNLESLDFRPENTMSPFTSELQPGINETSYGESLTKLQKLKKLKSLSIHCDKYKVTSAITKLAKKKSLEYLHIFNAGSDERLMRAFRKWPVAKSWVCWEGTSNYKFVKGSRIIPIIELV